MLLKCKKFGPISWTGKISTKLIYTKTTKKVIVKLNFTQKKKTAKKADMVQLTTMDPHSQFEFVIRFVSHMEAVFHLFHKMECHASNFPCVSAAITNRKS